MQDDLFCLLSLQLDQRVFVPDGNHVTLRRLHDPGPRCSGEVQMSNRMRAWAFMSGVGWVEPVSWFKVPSPLVIVCRERTVHFFTSSMRAEADVMMETISWTNGRISSLILRTAAL